MKVYSPATVETVKQYSPDAISAKWFEFAGRNLPFYFGFYHVTGNYPLLYPEFIGSRFEHILVNAKGKNWVMLRIKSEMEELRQNLSKSLQSKSRIEEILKKVESAYVEMWSFCNNRNHNEEDSLEYLKKFMKKHNVASTATSSVIEVCSSLALQIEKNISDEGDMIELAVPHKPTLQFEQEQNLLEIAIKIKEEKTSKEQAEQMLKKHFDDFAFVYFYVDEPIPPFETFLEENNNLFQESLESLKQKLVNKQAFQAKVDRKAEEVIAKYALDPELIALFRKGIYLRIYGESLFGLGNKASNPHFVNLAKKLGVALNQVKYLTFEEIEEAINGKLEYEKLIADRQRNCSILLSGQNAHVLNGSESEALMKSLNIEREAISNAEGVKGVAAVKGKVIGTARIVNEVSELAKVQQGDVLVAKNTTPTFVPAMKRACAIVTDEGGITCHAAIVSRELGLPCIIGTGNATKVLQDGDVVEVDADKGIVRKL